MSSRQYPGVPRLNGFIFEPTLKLFGQGQCRGVAPLRIFFEALQTNGGKIAVQFRIPQPRVPRFPFQKQPDCLVWGSRNEWRITSQQVIKHRAKPIHIGRVSDLLSLAISLFRGHIARRAQRFPRPSNAVCRVNHPRQTKVCEMRFAFCVYQDVPRFDIPVQNSTFVRILDRARQPCDEVGCPAWVLFASGFHVKRFAFN